MTKIRGGFEGSYESAIRDDLKSQVRFFKNGELIKEFFIIKRITNKFISAPITRITTRPPLAFPGELHHGYPKTNIIQSVEGTQVKTNWVRGGRLEYSQYYQNMGELRFGPFEEWSFSWWGFIWRFALFLALTWIVYRRIFLDEFYRRVNRVREVIGRVVGLIGLIASGYFAYSGAYYKRHEDAFDNLRLLRYVDTGPVEKYEDIFTIRVNGQLVRSIALNGEEPKFIGKYFPIDINPKPTK